MYKRYINSIIMIKNKAGRLGPPGPSPEYAKCPTNLPIDGNANIYVLRL